MNKLALKIIKNKARIAISVLVLLVFLGHAAGEFKIPLVERLENITYDVRVRMNVSSKKDDSVVIIDIDEKPSLQQRVGGRGQETKWLAWYQKF